MNEAKKNSDSNEHFKICIIGLGLIGGSLAKALRGFKSAELIGADINPDTRRKALDSGAVDAVYEDSYEAAADADLIILCVYPHHILEFVNMNAAKLKHGCIVTDVCGTKTSLYSRLESMIPKHIDYIGIHPMAGKEVDGFDNATGELFKKTGFLITPFSATYEKSAELMQQLGAFIGADKIAFADPVTHDSIIGYTSDLMHISATALCMAYHPQMSSAYTAGAFRDCTRIANINPELWTELLLTNAEAILPHLDGYIEYLTQMRETLQNNDNKKLYELLDLAKNNKREMLKR